MDEPEPRRPAAASDPAEEDLFDAYLDDVLAGRARRPSQFLAEHPDVSETFRTRVEELYASRRGRESEELDVAAPGLGLPFERLGEYRVLERLGEGGMGTVFLGEQESLGRLAALKVLRPEYQGSSTAAARFQREAHVVARLRHPNIVTVYGVGEENGVRFLAMEYVPGEGLDDVIARAAEERKPLPVATCVRWAAMIAGALQSAHEAGVVHRDVKPSNIRITPEGRPLLLDFGVALDDAPSRLTVEKAFLGTMVYASPEQAQSEGVETADVDARSDVYSLGVTLYEAITGRVPFDAGTTQQVLHRMLTEDAPPARTLRPGVSRDLEVVLQKAMEKDPARRYATAAAFADDLDAVLQFRPISARPAGPLRRAWKWARRHPGAASAIGAALVAAVSFAGVEHWLARAERARRVREAADLVTRADARVGRLEEQTRAWQRKLATREGLEHDLQGRYLAPEEHRQLVRLEHEISAFRREREAAHHEVLEMLRSAEKLDRNVVGAKGVRAKLYHARWRLALASGEREAAEFFGERVTELDEGGELARSIVGQGAIVVESDAPGTRGHLFRYEALDRLVEHGDSRLVPVPVDAPVYVLPPGAWALRAPRATGALRRGDLVFEVGGERVTAESWQALLEEAGEGASALVCRDGRRLSMTLAPGTLLRATAAPLAAGSARAVVGETWELPTGTYVLVARAPGREVAGFPFEVRQTGEPQPVRLRLPLAGTTPAGFVFVPADADRSTGDFWLMEREVTAAEYLEFLNDPATLAEIDAADSAIRYPRSPGTVVEGGHWPRGDDGLYRMEGELVADWPIIGVSYEDALAYAAWYTARHPREGFTYSLPSYMEWQSAGHGPGGRQYPWGSRFHPAWTSSCFSRPTANVEPVMTYPIDESWCGAYDMAGSMFEWLDDWFDEARDLRHVAGGSWGRADPKLFRIQGGQGARSTGAADEYGFRLVMRRTAR